MTSHYLEFKIDLPDADTGETSHLLGRLWQRLHGVLAGQDIRHVGVSLPMMGARHPGNVLRLHSDETTLQQVVANEGMRQLLESGGIRAGEILPTPAYCEYRCYTRSRLPEKYGDAWILRSEGRLLKHLEEKGIPLSASQLLARRKRLQERTPQAKQGEAYIKLQSKSTRQTFSLMIRTDPVEGACPGLFSHYGLSAGKEGGATVPFW
jgi:CRISPR-associated endoribonuclease Cas6/Csy4 subtype I-F